MNAIISLRRIWPAIMRDRISAISAWAIERRSTSSARMASSEATCSSVSSSRSRMDMMTSALAARCMLPRSCGVTTFSWAAMSPTPIKVSAVKASSPALIPFI
jgi:hypothetical protein